MGFQKPHPVFRDLGFFGFFSFIQVFSPLKIQHIHATHRTLLFHPSAGKELFPYRFFF